MPSRGDATTHANHAQVHVVGSKDLDVRFNRVGNEKMEIKLAKDDRVRLATSNEKVKDLVSNEVSNYPMAKDNVQVP